MTHDHDTGYKLLFSHPEMVRDLLIGYVSGEWIDEADFSTLERINASYVATTLKQRHDDVVWRVRLKERWLWIYALRGGNCPVGLPPAGALPRCKLLA